MVMVMLLFLLVDVLVLVGNIGLLWIITKLYTEILKVGHIKNIGKV